MDRRIALHGLVGIALACGANSTPDLAVRQRSVATAAKHTIQGNWMNVRNMTAPRARHTATLLNDGRVLIAGQDGSADVFAKGKFVATGTMTAVRGCCFTATLLGSGKVLVAGGGAFDELATAELWDPVTGTWSATGNMNTARHNHTSTLLADGRVLVAGGTLDNSGVAIASAEIYDPATGIWTPTGSMGQARGGHTALLIGGRSVLVAGGADTTNAGLASAEIYDPGSSAWATTGSLNTPRWGHRATLLSDGRALVTGGCCGPAELTSSEIYDPSTASWSPTGDTVRARDEGSIMVRLLDGTLLLAAGNVAEAERYDPVRGTWAVTASMGTARDYAAAVLLADGRALVTGGYTWICDPTGDNCSPEYQATAEVYVP